MSRTAMGMRSRFNNLTRLAMPAASLRGFSKDNFLSGSNANYIDYMYSQWQQDNSSVHASWNAYFTTQENGGTFELPPTLGAENGGLQQQIQ